MSSSPPNPPAAAATLYVNNINERVNPKKVRYVLHTLFGRYGHVVDISMSPALRMKGQAFVTYENSASCGAALAKLQHRPMFRKPIQISASRDPSDESRRRNGDSAGIERRKQAKAAKMASAKASAHSAPKTPFTKAQIRVWTALPPNSTLLYQNVPESEFSPGVLDGRFGAAEGFVKIRPLPFRNLAFVDFADEASATKCLEQTRTSLLPSTLLTYAKK